MDGHLSERLGGAMEEQGQEGSSDGWEGEREGRSNGWPMGLVPVSTASALLGSTPSLTSFSSSDFDTESTGSFFPEKSTTLGSLIGIQASSQFAEDETSSIEGEKARRKSSGGNNRGRAWWSLLGCRGGLRDDAVDVSPSLAHLLDNQRKETSSERRASDNYVESIHEDQDHEQNGGFQSGEMVSHRSRPCSNATVITSHPPGPSLPSLRLILQQPSPTSYLSTDWNVFSDLAQNHSINKHPSRDHGRFHTFWPGLCARLCTGVAN